MLDKKGRQQVYNSKIWKSIHPLYRAQILLVSERVKPTTYSSCINSEQILKDLSDKLGLFFTQAHGNVHYQRDSSGLLLQNKVFTICQSSQQLNTLRKLWQAGTSPSYWIKEGLLLGYPECCVKEYAFPTFKGKFNNFIVSKFNLPFTFKIECVKKIMEGGSIPDYFLYLAPSQTPCSINCNKSKRLLLRWKQVLYSHDIEAAKALEDFNMRNIFIEYHNLAIKLKNERITPEMFSQKFIFK